MKDKKKIIGETQLIEKDGKYYCPCGSAQLILVNTKTKGSKYEDDMQCVECKKHWLVKGVLV